MADKQSLNPSAQNISTGRFLAQIVLSQAPNAGYSITTDANDLTVLFARELENIDEELYETDFAVLNAADMVPFEKLGGPSVLTETYREVTEVGQAKWEGNQGSDYPLVNAVGKETIRNVARMNLGYKMTVHELAQIALRPTINLEATLKKSCMNGIARFHEGVALIGDTEKAWKGLFNTTSVPLISITGGWAAAAPDVVLKDIIKLYSSVIVATKKNIMPDTMALPLALFEVMNKPIVSGAGSETVMSFLKKNLPQITTYEWSPYLDLANAGGNGPRCMIYKRSKEIVRYGANAMYQELPPQLDGFDIKVPAFGVSSGTQFIKPLGAAYADGL
jgi:hypothetical protein